jgi:CcmD family protein
VSYVVAAYLVAGVMIGGYALSLVLRRRKALRAFQAADQVPSAEPDDDGSAGDAA